MKKVMTTLLFLNFSMVLFSQSDAQHLKFKGIEINGTIDNYVDKMKSAGFEFFGIKNGVAILKGEFAGYKNCDIIVSTLKSIDKVKSIRVEFPDRMDWTSLEGDYINLKSMLTEKYGEPSETIEDFQGYLQRELDSDKLFKVKCDEYTWLTVFTTENGDIQLSIINDKSSKRYRLYVQLQYFDKTNTEVVRARAMEDL